MSYKTKKRKVKKFVSNGRVSDLVPAGSLMELMYGGYNPMSEAYLDELTDGNYLSLENGVISYYGTHVFSKCNDTKCEICAKYKNNPNVFKVNWRIKSAAPITEPPVEPTETNAATDAIDGVNP